MASVRLFAQARVAARRSTDRVDAATVGAALDDLVGRYGDEFAGVLAGCRIWVDGQAAEPSDPLPDGSELAVLPPVSGGGA